MTIPDIIYYTVINTNFIVSIAYKRLWKQFFFLYFGVTVGAEILITAKADFITARIYNYLDLFCIGYFGYIYYRETGNSMVIKITASVFLLLSSLFIFISETDYSIMTGYLYCLFLIFISLFWLYRKISRTDEDGNILNQRFFWLSSSLLFWAVFYIFRMLPMYFFNTTDRSFLMEIAKVFTFINIITYLLFLRSLFCRQ
ncbi:hypothetical protein BBI00_18615 [Chryseobacterium arthrosphaerae]|uniref:Uncharacterized protein n=1 Tax=Chryseobacterium arthrosphaerae TaxID=651561 RepID=A0A1B8ZJC2_9FLAO|nr:hypothetical protein BBI00_18615 [Chryseobacterium arthrosphaerae]